MVEQVVLAELGAAVPSSVEGSRRDPMGIQVSMAGMGKMALPDRSISLSNRTRRRQMSAIPDWGLTH